MDSKKYRYKAKWSIIALIILFFGAASYFYFYLATTNSKGLIINGFIELSINHANIFYWVLFMFSSLFVLIGLLQFKKNLNGDIYLFLQKDKIILPPLTLLKKHFKEIYFKDILYLNERGINSNIYLDINTLNEKYTIQKSMLPSKDAYMEIKSILLDKINTESNDN